MKLEQERRHRATPERIRQAMGVVAASEPARLPRFEPEYVAVLNALHRPRPPFTLALGERSLRLSVAQDSDPALPMTVGISMGEAVATLHLSPRSLAALTRHLALRLPLEQCAGDLLALWLEYALLGWIEPLEARLGCAIQLHAATLEPVDATALRIVLRVEDEAPAGDLALSLSAAALRRLAPLLKSLPPPLAKPCSALPMTVQWIAGRQQLRLGELRSLVPGDVVLLEPPAKTLMIAGQLLAEAVEKDDGLHLLAPVSPTVARSAPEPAPFDDDSRWKQRRHDDMAENTQDPQAAPEAALDELPVQLACEFGRLELTLGELRTLDAGSVLPLKKPAQEAVDILVNGRRMGRGRLVEIGDSLGVQIVRLQIDG
ncbi:type III secretion system cytoplasmic ring protein SctQ [Halomonas sp. MCCC 1A11036]|uniref:Type III secretion system cytoplasmic ring protein SctQ n=1 Tax=Billgrantia zhangzhouensis TaxID=2733481 RepID=A0ABS9AF39_9GAMM|nr:type III secretion system cytoplasmic ring protein SctQ [Halomonas zhangzhouensis]MCE8020373.1 type III secretion system cytoplasmic ring protein SctQ [Halomonas zhangzhouensis]